MYSNTDILKLYSRWAKSKPLIDKIEAEVKLFENSVVNAKDGDLLLKDLEVLLSRLSAR